MGGANNVNGSATASSTLSTEDREALKMRTLEVSRVIVNTRECHQVVDEMLRAGQPVGLDGEGVNLGPKGFLTLIQISTIDGKVFIFDVKTNPTIFTEGKLKKLLQSTDIVKVIHDCRNDSAALYKQHRITLSNVFDTQAAFAVLNLQETGTSVYKSRNVSFNALCEQYNAPVNPMKDQVKKVYKRDQRFWARRPLTKDMICYAAADVLALVPTIHTAMARKLKPENQSLFKSLCEEHVLVFIQGNIKEKQRKRREESDVAELKLKIASAQTKNILLSNKEIKLLSKIKLTEDERQSLIKSSSKLKKLSDRQYF